MKFGLPRLAMPPILLGYVALVVASASAGHLATTNNSSDSDGDSGFYSSASDSGREPSGEKEPHAPSRLRDSIEMLELRLALLDKKEDILALVDDRRFDFNSLSMCRYIEEQKESFFDALVGSGFCPPLDKEAEVWILGMSPKSFGEWYDAWYGGHAEACENKARECSAKRKDLESKAQNRSDRNEASEKALKAALEERKADHDNSIVELQACKAYHKKIETLSCRVLGENSVSALYKSYLAGQRSLARKEDEYDRLHKRSSPSEEVAGSSQKPGHKACAICARPSRLGEEGIRCAKGHKFHKRCAYEWSELESRACPVCREDTFPKDQQDVLSRYRRKQRDYLCNTLGSDPRLEKKYMHRGEPIDVRGDLLEAMCGAIRRCVRNLRSHPSYPSIFNSPQSSVYRRFYIPRILSSYFENTEKGHHDPRCRAFTERRAMLVKYVLDYKKQRSISPYLEFAGERVFLDRYIIRPIDSVLNTFYAVDALLEYSCKKLHKIKDLGKRRSAVLSSPEAYPVLHSLVARSPNETLDQICRNLELVIRDDDPPVLFYSQEWLLTVSRTFSHVISEI